MMCFEFTLSLKFVRPVCLQFSVCESHSFLLLLLLLSEHKRLERRLAQKPLMKWMQQWSSNLTTPDNTKSHANTCVCVLSP